ncbi:antiviral RADAR system adenosine triphosphatase RdrA [Pseudomonas moraviensis]|uniref:Skp family chaperone for outer membrane proteins n=1 Tax=Pseudomonas moraviensis TaxID=321662 RepID=A0A7Y9VS29_9PSED|nr:antiviral RADAR system adenosine triphosphatase RdrA [Pseudomonas moraviensis]NYH07073.1 Skp family chaperone for outer membrane proteins [Pseudomonas moraviensis]
MAESNNIEIELPIDQGEQAYQRTAKTLLAQDVYQKIAEHLKTSRNKTPDPKSQANDLDNYRSHEAILIDGGRGTGKSSVLVNLATYLENDKDLLILKPVDPTLLENGDDLLLNVIVAALMRDDTVRKALQNNERDAEAFYEQLHKLGAALEGIQKQKEQYGLDKLRAFMGNQSLAEHVHLLLKTTLSLTSRKLVVLPIDDVDTSLQLAFDNIEVVRKYLTSPFIVPLISGDLSLYDEVIWREFHKRLTHKKAVIEESAALRAKDLAEEYQRKVLPLPRRIKLPALTSYLQNQKIILTNQGSKIFPLAVLQYWLNALLNERVNGEENSRLEFPLQTVREMTQFINGCKHLIPSLNEHLNLDLNSYTPLILPTMLKRLLFMPLGIAQAVQEFEEDYNKATFSSEPHRRDVRSGKERAYRALGKNTQDVQEESKSDFLPYLQQWYTVIADYFQYHRKGGAAYFTAFTNEKWLTDKNHVQKTPVLDHDLFQPLQQSNKKYENFEPITGIKKTWTEVFANLVPQAWIERIPESTILSFPVPEKGQRIHLRQSSSWSLNPYTSEELQGKAELARQLLVHWSFFSPNQRANLVFHGRTFELIVASLVRDISEVEITEIINRPPFHSMAALAHTNTLNLSEAFDATEDESKDEISTEEALKGDQKTKETISDLANEINNWRRQNNIQVPHSWLIFNVMNKAFNQIGVVSTNKKQASPSALEIIDSGMRMFNSVWSAFGSFEKGETFGLPRIIAYVNMSNSSTNFEQHAHYRQNILPFLQKINNKEQHHNFKTGSYTFALESHPLRELLRELLNNNLKPQKSTNMASSEIVRRLSLTRAQQIRAQVETATNVAHEILNTTTTQTSTDLSTRINKIINATAREQGIVLKNNIIKGLETKAIQLFLNSAFNRCDAVEFIELNEITQGKKVPSGTPQRHFQYMYEQYQLRKKASTSEPGSA